MSIFPAYSGQFQESTQRSADWLTNSSYTFPSQTTVKREIEEGASTSKNKGFRDRRGDTSSKRKKRKKGKKKKKEQKEKEEKREKLDKTRQNLKVIAIKGNDKFFIDKEKSQFHMKLSGLPKTLKPRYNTKSKISFQKPVPKKKKKKEPRYFQFLDTSEGCKEGNLLEEAIVTKKTEEFNRKLTENPGDFETWKEFVNFQDEFYKYQHIKYRSKIERERAAASHKLCILDKAVAQNPENKDLQALWLQIGTKVLPSEEMSMRIEKILKESGGTMTLWLGLMTTTQHSLARCTVPSVRGLYEKLLLNFQNVKPPNTHGRDLNVLELLFHYGRFLDNTGHWEILWTMIKVNLQFNTNVSLNFDIKVEDEKVKQLENAILEQEKQAIWQLWNQLERLREGFHFLPDADSVEYPQRCVSPDVVVNFTWHFHPDVHFQLIVSFIVLLKVPILPCTDTTLKMLSPNSLPWVFDSPEYILSAVLTPAAVSLKFDFLSCISQLSRGPQYLRRIHGQTEFLALITKTFEACFKCLEGRKKFALGVWWLRFEGWIHLLQKLDLASLPEDRKSAKSFFKEFLKASENRDNILYYIEYSLFEYNQGNVDICTKTLQTLISSRPPVLKVSDDHEKSVLTSAYRSLCQVLVGTNRRKEALNLLINLGSGNQLEAKVSIHSFAAAEKKFEHLSVELISELNSETPCSFEDVLLPLFIVEWISCYLWLIALSKTPADLKNCFTKILNLLEERSGFVAEQTRECLWETMLSISWVFQKDNFPFMKEILKKSFEAYPRNLKILSVMTDVDHKNNTCWWTLKKFFLSPPTMFGCIFLICVSLSRFKRDKENFQNRVKNLLEDLALNEGKLSCMVHCLRLRFLYENEKFGIEKAQLQALEGCPWNKSIYMDSILLLPAKLMVLTDVLIEKELRIHITPDEIQEMRS